MGQTGGERWEAACQNKRKRGREAIGQDLTSQTTFFFPVLFLFFLFFFKKEHFLCQQQPQQHPNYKFGWHCSVAQGYAEFTELEHSILPFASGIVIQNKNLQVKKKRGGGRGNNSNNNYELRKSQQISRNSYCFPLSIFHNHCKTKHIKFQYKYWFMPSSRNCFQELESN